MLEIYPSSRFKRSFKKIPACIKKDFIIQVEIFKNDSFNFQLKTHKLKGKLSNHYSFYLQSGFRVLFNFIKNNKILLINIGSHDDYKKWRKN
ncbi:MAG: type II toxin-antitoxin system mRNA interferase toxin, RelE/StbE family [Patescibacteria group bacterium]